MNKKLLIFRIVMALLLFVMSLYTVIAKWDISDGFLKIVSMTILLSSFVSLILLILLLYMKRSNK